jgi:predicted lipoprotein with Yx(FWY)xxD motif
MHAPKLFLASGLTICLLALSLAADAARSSSSTRAVVKTAFNKKLKRRILVTGNGMTLYLFAQDRRNTPTCVDDPDLHCSQAWPPHRSTGAPVAKGLARPSLLRTVQRTDGDPQVTYKGHPLYTDAGRLSSGLHADRKPGQINGQGFGEIWWVVSPKGNAITALP